jgi:hypothetical protein
MPSMADIELWCFHCGADSQIPDLTAAARGIEKMYVELKRLLRSGTASYQRELLKEETRTRHFRIFNPAVIPGALQTQEYATTRLTEFADMVGIPADIEDTVTARMERGRLLLSGDRLFHFVLGEHALRAALADRDVMADQLRHLLEVSRLPRLRSASCLPASRHYMTFCGFWIFDNRVVQLETYSAAITVTQPREIAMYAKVFEHYSGAPCTASHQGGSMRSREARSAPPGTDQAHGLRQWWLDLSLRAKGLIVVAVPLIALMGITSANLVLQQDEATSAPSAPTPVTWITRPPRFSPTR